MSITSELQAQREKDWEELNSDEKIERMRQIVKNQSYQIGSLQTNIHTLRRKLSKHEHFEGKVIERKEIREYDEEGASITGAASLNQSNYF